MNYDFEKIGKRISAERKKLKLTQSEFLQKLNEKGVSLSRTTLSFIESGKATSAFTLDVLAGICSVLDCELGYLLCEPGYTGKTKHTTKITQETGLSPKAVLRLKRLQNTDAINVYRAYLNGKEYDDNMVIPAINCLLEHPHFTRFLYDLMDHSCLDPGHPAYGTSIGGLFTDLEYLTRLLKENYDECDEEYKPFVANHIATIKDSLDKSIEYENSLKNTFNATVEDYAGNLIRNGYEKDVAFDLAREFVMEHGLPEEEKVDPPKGTIVSFDSAFINMVRDVIEGKSFPREPESLPDDYKDMPLDKKLNVVFRSKNPSTIKELPKKLKQN